jgi:hypothetical protein
VSIAGCLEFSVAAPSMPYAGCRGRGVLTWFDKAAQGDSQGIERSLACCNLCSERVTKCKPWSLTLQPAERTRLGVVGGVSYVTPSRPPGRPGQPKSDPAA